VDRRVRATPTLVRDYLRLFVNRRAYTLQSVRSHPESGRHYYFRPKERGTGAPLALTEKTVSRHLEGEITICDRPARLGGTELAVSRAWL